MSFVAPQALLDAVQPLLGSTIGDDAVRAPSSARMASGDA